MCKYIYFYIYICVHIHTFIYMFYVCICTGLPGNMSKKADVGKTTLRKLDKYTLSKVIIAFIYTVTLVASNLTVEDFYLLAT